MGMKAPKIMYDFEKAKEEYRAFCDTEGHDIQIFAQPWYLDAACDSPDDWRVILYKDKDKIVAAFPFQYIKGKYGLWHIRNPGYAPRLGIWIDYQGKTRRGAIEQYENTIVQYMISHLPYYDKLNIAFDSRFTNWHQFYWSGYQQTTFYSYIFPLEIDVMKNLASNSRRRINALMNEFYVDESITLDQYWEFFEYSYKLRKRTFSFSKANFYKLLETVLSKKCVKLVACKDLSGKIYSTGCAVYDQKKMYFMFTTYDPTLDKNTQPLVTMRLITLAKEMGLTFDFQGSMIQGVANHNSRFNPLKEPYFMISNYSAKYRLLNSVRDVFSALKQILKGDA